MAHSNIEYRAELRAKILAVQDGKCFLCGKPLELAARKGSKKALRVTTFHGPLTRRTERSVVYLDRDARFVAHLDHDHVTGRIRGVLCCRCNQKLSALDDPDWALRASDYLASPPFNFPWASDTLQTAISDILISSRPEIEAPPVTVITSPS